MFSLVMLIFRLAGIGLLISAIRRTLQYKEFGVSYFVMSSVPGVVGGPLVAAIIIGCMEIPIALGAAALWLFVRRTTIDSGMVTLRGSLLGLTTSHRVACSDIADLRLDVGMQTGGATGTPYYDITLILKNGRKRTAGGQIRNKREALWVMNKMKEAIISYR